MGFFLFQGKSFTKNDLMNQIYFSVITYDLYDILTVNVKIKWFSDVLKQLWFAQTKSLHGSQR